MDLTPSCSVFPSLNIRTSFYINDATHGMYLFGRMVCCSIAVQNRNTSIAKPHILTTSMLYRRNTKLVLTAF